MLRPEPTGSVREADQAAATVSQGSDGGTDRVPADLETFVIIHDQDALLRLESEGTFSNLSSFKFVFVGSRPTDLVYDREDVIVARLLPDNIEQHANLLSFTGWYAVARNDLAVARHVALLEYDVKVTAELERVTLAGLLDAHSIVGYVPVRLTNPMYLHSTPWFMEAMSSTYGIDVPALLREHLQGGGADLWTATTNHAMRREDLAAFVDWFMPLAQVFWHDPLGGVHERAVPVFCLTRGIADRYSPGVLHHLQVESHGFACLPYEEAQRRANEAPPLLTPGDAYSRLLESDLRSRRAVRTDPGPADSPGRAVRTDPGPGNSPG